MGHALDGREHMVLDMFGGRGRIRCVSKTSTQLSWGRHFSNGVVVDGQFKVMNDGNRLRLILRATSGTYSLEFRRIDENSAMTASEKHSRTTSGKKAKNFGQQLRTINKGSAASMRHWAKRTGQAPMYRKHLH